MARYDEPMSMSANAPAINLPDTVEGLAAELNALDGGIKELTARRKATLEALDYHRKSLSEIVNNSNDNYYALTRSDEAMPDRAYPTEERPMKGFSS